MSIELRGSAAEEEGSALGSDVEFLEGLFVSLPRPAASIWWKSCVRRASGSVAEAESLLAAVVAAALESCIRFMVCWILSWKVLLPAVSVSDPDCSTLSSFDFLSRPSDDF